MDSRGMGLISYALIRSEVEIQLETWGEDHYLLYVKDPLMRETSIRLNRDAARHLAQDILNHIKFMEEKEAKERASTKVD